MSSSINRHVSKAAFMKTLSYDTPFLPKLPTIISHYYVLAPPPHSHSRPVSLPLRLLSLSVATLCGVDECMKGTISVGLGVKVCVSITFLSFWVLWCFLLFIQNWNLFQGKVGLIFTLSFFFFFCFFFSFIIYKLFFLFVH